jgi:transposase
MPVLNVDGYWEIYQDSFTTERFNAFIEIFILPLMRPYSEDAPCCILVMDNHSIHYSEELEVMCERKGIRPVYLPPDLNPIKQGFCATKGVDAEALQDGESIQ